MLTGHDAQFVTELCLRENDVSPEMCGSHCAIALKYIGREGIHI
jgi:hypothetical protein